MFSIWINGILSSLDGYFVHKTDFLALVKVLLTYIWRWLTKCSSSSFHSACGDRGLKQIRKFFSNKCHLYSLLSQNEGKRKVFLERSKEGWYRVRLPQIARSFLWDFKSFSFCEIWIIPPLPLLSFRAPLGTIKCCVDNR